MTEELRTKPIKYFDEVTALNDDSYILGIGDIGLGNGVRFKLSTFLQNSISSDIGNSLTVGTDEKLFSGSTDVNIIQATSGTILLSDNSINRMTISGNTSFTLPTNLSSSKFHHIMVQINLQAVSTINVGTTVFFDKTAPSLTETGNYNLIFEHDGTNWVCGFISKGQS